MLSGKTIVLADDNQDMLKILTQRCTRLGLQVYAAEDAMTALSTVDFIVPDVICLDVEMPNGNGLAACEMISGDNRFEGVPIIILTGRSDDATVARCRDMHAHYVRKGPDTWTRIEALLYELLPESEEPECVSGLPMYEGEMPG